MEITFKAYSKKKVSERTAIINHINIVLCVFVLIASG